MKPFSSRRRMVVIAVLILLVLFLVRPGASRLKSRIIHSMSAALGRSVDIGSVHIRFLPHPGFDLENLVVYDDPAFGAEPILRAGDVAADLRLLSMLRGRIEISRLDLSEPSLNLVHGSNGRWNLEALLERTAHMPLAPTSKAKSEPRPGFPYIEASSARINLKNGPEKKPYALTNADFSLWQDSENTWGVRLKAQPFRTDLNLADVGLLRASGTWQRADSLRNTPVQLEITWSRAQLGQITKFFTGNDQGWRGTGELELKLSGTPANLHIASNAVLQDFRRYDITSGDALRLAAACNAQYSAPEHTFRDIDCKAPVGEGSLSLKGESGLPGSRSYNLMLTAENVPASAALALIERAKKNLPDDLVATGNIEGSFLIAENAGNVSSEGQGKITDFQLSSAAEKTQIGRQTIPFSLVQGTGAKGARRQSALNPGKLGVSPNQDPVVSIGSRLAFGPILLSSGRAAPSALGWISRGGYGISISGEGEVSRLLHLARLGGIPALQANAEGSVQLDLQVAGLWVTWSSATPVASGPKVTGSATLHNVRAVIRGTSEPVQISSAEVQLASDAVHVIKLNAKAADSLWIGTLDMPRGCGAPDACPIHFDLATSKLSLGSLAEFSNPAKERPWYSVLESSSSSGPSFLENVRASGRIRANSLEFKSFSASHVSANVTLARGKIELSQLNASVLGGMHKGDWEADFSTKPGRCRGSGTLSNVSLSQLAQSMSDGWITGAANATYELKGSCPADFWSSAEGTVTFDAHDGTLPHVSLSEMSMLRFSRLSGHAKFRDAKLELQDAKLESASGNYQVTGTTSAQRKLNLKLTRTGNAATGYSLSGSLSDPHITQIGTEQARSKP